MSNGRGGYTPIVLVPESSRQSCFCLPCCFIAIPEGFSAIVKRFGAEITGDEEDGTWSPGFHWLSPEKNVDRLVTKQHIVFDTPVKQCTSKDNMPVTIDILVVFKICDAVTFYKTYGPDMFQTFLVQNMDEMVRTLALEKRLDEMYDIFGEDTQKIMEELNSRFNDDRNKTGVQLVHFCIKDIVLSQDIIKLEQDKTLIQSQLRKDEIMQDFNKTGITNQEETRRLKEECENSRKMASAEAQVEQQMAVRKTQEVMAQTQSAISEKEATKLNDAMKIQTDGEFELTKIQSQIRQITEELKVKTSSEVNKISVEATAYSKKKEIHATETYAENIARGKTALGEAEGVASAAFAARRKHEAELKRLEILDKLVGKNMTIATSQENTAGLSADNAAVTQVGQQGLEALRAKLAEITATSLSKIAPKQASMAS
jgi:regulator of protease activity HflC (stomatin/prohibitin superfamily)